jgi:anti-sigma factor RsiW
MAVGGRATRLARYAVGEVTPAEGRALEGLLQRCPACRREVLAYRASLAALRATAPIRLTPGEASAFCPEVLRRLDRARPTPRRARPGLSELFGDHPRLGLASAAAAVLLALGLTLGQFMAWGPSGGMNGVEILSVEVDDESPFMLFQAPGSALKIIWLFEAPQPS